MRKQLLILIMLAAALSACTNGNDEPDQPQTVSLPGQWLGTTESYLSIVMTDLNGNLIDSIDAGTPDPRDFTFTETKVTTPWMLTYNYTVEGDSIVMRYTGFPDRSYGLHVVNADKIILHREVHSEYTMDETEPVDGREIEHWVMTRKQ